VEGPRDGTKGDESCRGKYKMTTNAGATSASRQTCSRGNMVKDASLKLVVMPLMRTVDVLKIPKSLLVLENGFAMDSRLSERGVSLA
jgi:hypothetical protein